MHANILSHDVTYKIGMPGRHMAMNSLAVLAGASLLGADLARAALSLSQLEAPAGRGVRRILEVGHGEATLIDESYNANPASMGAALNVLGQATVGPHGRRIADPRRHARTRPDRAGAAPRSGRGGQGQPCRSRLLLWSADAQSVGRSFHRQAGGYADSSASLEAQAVAAIRPGDAIMVKGSLGSKMKLIVNALEKRFPAKPHTKKRYRVFECFTG